MNQKIAVTHSIPPLRRIIIGLTSASLLFSTTLTPAFAQGGPPGVPPGVAVGQAGNVYSAEELDAIVAPIALYPDQLLTQVLMASAFPDQVVAAAQWVGSGYNRNLNGAALDRALRPLPWDPAVKSLVPFPQVLEMLSTHGEWMAQLAFAVAEQEAATFDSVQRLRRQARLAGYLRTTQQQVVRFDGDLIVIQPVTPNVIYVPVYNPQVVYGSWAYPSYPPYYFPPRYNVPNNLLTTGIYFGVGVVAVTALWGWATPRWRERHFYVDPRRYDYFRQNYQAPPGDWRRWDQNQWRPPVRVERDQARPTPPRPTDNQFRPPVQRPGEGQVRPMPGQPSDGQGRPVPPRPGEGQVRPMPGQPSDGQGRPVPPRPGEGQMRPMPAQPSDGQGRPVPPRPGAEQMRPMPAQPNEGQGRPVSPRPGEGQMRPMPAQPSEGQGRAAPPRPGEGQMRPMPGQSDEGQGRRSPRQDGGPGPRPSGGADAEGRHSQPPSGPNARDQQRPAN